MQLLAQEFLLGFAGFDLTSIDVNAESLVEEAYDKGVPMGADLFADGEKVRIFGGHKKINTQRHSKDSNN